MVEIYSFFVVFWICGFNCRDFSIHPLIPIVAFFWNTANFSKIGRLFTNSGLIPVKKKSKYLDKWLKADGPLANNSTIDIVRLESDSI